MSPAHHSNIVQLAVGNRPKSRDWKPEEGSSAVVSVNFGVDFRSLINSVNQKLLAYQHKSMMMETARFHCALCSLLQPNNKSSRFSTMNESKNHARIHFGQIQMLEVGDIDEKQMFERCFPKPKRKICQARQALAVICKSLIRKHPKPSSIDCNLCGSDITVKKQGFVTTSGMIIHASIHAGVKPYKCRHCEYSFRARSNVLRHLKRVHGIKHTTHDFEDRFEEFHDEISNSIKRCLTKCKGGAPSKETKEKTREYITARSGSMTNASELSIQRQSVFNRSIKNHMNSYGKIKCRLCSKKIKAVLSVRANKPEQVTSQWAVRHAQYHLGKPLYRCKVCSESLNTYRATLHHLRRKHTLGMDKNHECFADKFHSDILTVFAQCYGKDRSVTDA